jgi:hypothetical protein
MESVIFHYQCPGDSPITSSPQTSPGPGKQPVLLWDPIGNLKLSMFRKPNSGFYPPNSVSHKLHLGNSFLCITRVPTLKSYPCHLHCSHLHPFRLQSMDSTFRMQADFLGSSISLAQTLAKPLSLSCFCSALGSYQHFSTHSKTQPKHSSN